MYLLSLLLVVSTSLCTVKGHGYMADPPARNVMWQFGFPNPKNFDATGVNCGGTKNQWENQGGKCGLCGDPFQGPRKHEAGYPGGYANGIIARVYKKGQTIDVLIKISANHFGWFEFRLCANNDPTKAVTQECFDKNVLVNTEGETRHRVVLSTYKGNIKFKLVLPPDVTCTDCVLQWFWYSGNSKDRIAQETFVNCADVAITNPDGSIDGSLQLPHIYEAAYKTIPEDVFKLGEGKPVGVPGQWDCDVKSPYDGAKRQVYYDWCLENCLYAQPSQRDCNPEICRCFRTDVKMSSAEERQLLGIGDKKPTAADIKTPLGERKQYLDGTWDCDVPAPYNAQPDKRKIYYDWCLENCVYARPYERNCPVTHCNCYRTDVKLSDEEIRKLLAPIPTGATPPPPKAPEPYDNNWKQEAKVVPNPSGGGLQGSWDCDVLDPYTKDKNKKIGYYEWCLDNCINAKQSDRHCADNLCRCYRTDRQFTDKELTAQLFPGTGSDNFNAAEGERRGVPPGLDRIITNSQQKALEGEWSCRVVSPYSESNKKEQYYSWCMKNCIQALPSDRQCPANICYCYRTDKTYSHDDELKQLTNQISLSKIVHSESGEKGRTAQGPKPNSVALLLQQGPVQQAAPPADRNSILSRFKQAGKAVTSQPANPSVPAEQPRASTGKNCKGLAKLRNPEGDTWCMTNCLYGTPSYCPSDLCLCS